MGKITGFMELERIREVALPVEERVRHYREFILMLKDDDAPTPFTVYLNVDDKAATAKPRQTAVAEFLKDKGLTEQQIDIVFGDNPDSRSPAAKETRLDPVASTRSPARIRHSAVRGSEGRKRKTRRRSNAGCPRPASWSDRLRGSADSRATGRRAAGHTRSRTPVMR